MTIISTENIDKTSLMKHYINHFKIPFIDSKWFIFFMSILLIMLITLYIIFIIGPKNSKNQQVTTIIKAIICSVIFILWVSISFAMCLLYQNKEETHLEMQHYHPHYRTAIVKGKVDNITNGSHRSTQEIRFSNHGENYYVTTSSQLPVRSGDDIKVIVKHQLIDDKMNQNNLSHAFNNPKGTINITHDGQTYSKKLVTSKHTFIRHSDRDVKGPSTIMHSEIKDLKRK